MDSSQSGDSSKQPEDSSQQSEKPSKTNTSGEVDIYSGSEISSTVADQATELVGYAVEPKTDCKHFTLELLEKLKKFFGKYGKSSLELGCKDCEDSKENWVCLTCSGLFCSRYVSGHMQKHHEQNSSHNIAFSLSDGSFWCYGCDSYIQNIPLREFQKQFSGLKHGTSPTDLGKQEDDGEAEYEALADKLMHMKLLPPSEKESKEFTYQNLINGLKEEKGFKKVIFLTGAGISVSAGIPDFRTPGSGLYSQLAKYNLPFPEAIFEINYFQKAPQAFMKLSKEFLFCGSHFTSAHFFIAETFRRSRLLMNFSQNIDGLELDAGLPLDKLVQAHGHFRSAKCVRCKAVNPIDDFTEAAKNDQICICKKCEKGIVKPDIVFFGENLPVEFFQNCKLLEQADLVFVMGTSLKVFPFASLVDLIEEKVPIVLLNRENPGIVRSNFLFMEGDIDDSAEKIMKDLDWKFPEIKRTYPEGTIKEGDSSKSKL